MKKFKIFIIILIFIFLIFGYRYYKVNKNIPSKFTAQCYNHGEYANCDGLKIKIISTKVEPTSITNKFGTEFINLTVNSEVVNSTSKIKNGIYIETSPIVINYYFMQSDYPKISNNCDLKNIKPGEKFTMTQVYTLEKDIYEKNKNNIYMYLSQELYPIETRSKFYKNIRYVKQLKI